MKKREFTDDREYTEGIAVKGGFLGWLDNYWYHYKWVTVGVAFALLVVVICTVQMCSKEGSDLTVLYAGRNQLSAAEAEDICDALEAVCPEDFDGNGKKQIDISTYCILSEEQIKALKEKDSDAYYDSSYNSEQYNTYYTALTTGEYSVLFLDPWLYEKLASADRLVALDDALGYTPDSAYGEYGVRLGDTALYEQYGVMELLPEDTVVCLMQPYVVGKNSKEKNYAREKKMFEAIVSYGK